METQEDLAIGMACRTKWPKIAVENISCSFDKRKFLNEWKLIKKVLL